MANHVCPECKGEGSVGPGFVFTQDDMDQYDPDEFADFQRDLRNGQYDNPCPYCKGKRVITTEQRDEYQDWLDYRAEVAAEQRMGA